MQLWKVLWTPRSKALWRANLSGFRTEAAARVVAFFVSGVKACTGWLPIIPLARQYWAVSECNPHFHTLAGGRPAGRAGGGQRHGPCGLAAAEPPPGFRSQVQPDAVQDTDPARGKCLDYQSLQVLEGARPLCRKQAAFPGGSERVLADLQLIDVEMCKEVLEQIRRGVSV